jgi:saccharopine dehydrogenase-like NADP-dependent oxidoreductase
VFFETKSKLHVNDLQSVYIKRKGNIVFQGNVTPTISSIQIVKPGEFWQKGQIIRLKSLDQNSKDTLIRV